MTKEFENFFTRTLEKISKSLTDLGLKEVSEHYHQGEQAWLFQGEFEGHTFEVVVTVWEPEVISDG